MDRMNKNLQSPTKLTEFAPLQSEGSKSQSVGQFLSSFFKKAKNSVPEESSNENSGSPNQDSLPIWANDCATEASECLDVSEGRSLPNVLKRISNLLALKSTNLQDYGDTDLKRYWMPDSVSKECYECSEKFTTFRRKHHCRVCGQIFCSQCCNQQIPGKIFGCTGDLRVCTYCCKVVLSYLQSTEFSNEDLKVLQENLQTKFAALSPRFDNEVAQALDSNAAERNNPQRKISVGYQEEKFSSGSISEPYMSNEEKLRALQNSSSLRNLFEEIYKPMTGVQLETHRHRLRTCTECILGSDLVDWLIFQQKAKNRIQASALCQALLEGGYIECLSESSTFIDGNAFYKKGTILSPEMPRNNEYFEMPLQEEPTWVQQISQEFHPTDSDSEQLSPITLSQGNLKSSSSYMLDLNLEANTVYLSRPLEADYKSPEKSDADFYEHEQSTIVRPSEQLETAPESGWFNPTNLREENGENLAYTILTEAYKQHEHSFIKQLLASKGLSHSWAEIIIPLVHDIISIIRPDKNHDAIDLDIRHYVQFKILSGGLHTDTSLIGGIVCSKNVAHRGMSTDIENPKILLLQCSVVYQRTEGRLMSLEPVLMQEHEYLRNVSARIVALQPNVVLVHKNVSRLAQDMLREHKITLVHNVKLSVLERLSRCTQADLVTAVDAHIGRPKLGTCKRFYVKSFNTERGMTKTLMFFEGLPVSHLGATVLLRGASKPELAILKNISSLMLFTAYNWRLEKSYLMDEFAMPPYSKYEFLDDSKENSPEHLKMKRASEEDKTMPEISKRNERTMHKPVGRDENETKRIVVETVNDFTDPLHAYDSEMNPDSGMETLTVTELPFSNNFRKCLDDTILCISPFIMFSVPYLETETGKKSKLRNFFPKNIYYSEHFTEFKKNKKKDAEDTKVVQQNNSTKNKPYHPFLTMKIITSADNIKVQNMLSHFRACGGRYEKREHVCLKKPPTDSDKHEDTENTPKDVLDPKNHQRLAVLFCSYSSESVNAPAFCVNPWVVYMEFYGRNDIPLGCFLERYCFRSTYKCPSTSCDTPMVKHVRRFVHNSGCVSIYLNFFENEFSEDEIVMWTWCTKCQTVSPVVPMSGDSWSYSFAKYLELKFHGDVFNRRGLSTCTHSLHHDHYQYFGYKNYVASFKYSAINIWEISLPPLIVEIKHDTNILQNQLIDEVRTVAQKGHEMFSLIQDKLSTLPTEDVDSLKQTLIKEQAHFKQKVEEVQLKLTSPTIENKDFDEKSLYGAYCKILDKQVRIKRSILETIEAWNVRLTEALRKKDIEKKKEKSVPVELDSPSNEENTITEQFESLGKTPVDGTENFSTKKMRSLDAGDDDVHSNPSPKTYNRSQSDAAMLSHFEDSTDSKKESDKNMVKNIFSHLRQTSTPFPLIPSPFNCQEHYALPENSIPLVVYENEPSSIVAYTLSSGEYKKAFEDLKKLQSSDQSPSPVSKRKNGIDKEKSEEEKPLNLLGFLRNKEMKVEGNNPNSTTTPTNCENCTDQAVNGGEKSEDMKKMKNSHIEVQFQDSICNFFCRVYLADKFAALRSSVLSIGEEGYIRSLSRSIQWDARGGKSGSNFSKTTDDRFILKEMSKSEVELFLESASNYFAYMNKCTATKQPTLLGKIVGIYQIVFKNNTIQMKNWLLVMENLFYNRNVTQKFDLKGSVRNRFVPENQEGEIVLLDENLMKMTCDSPLYILPHSKSVLIAAIQNDTDFLCMQSVMDYSLLVGLDTERKELILGIIDYIRTFTWDKKLETFVKKRVLPGQGKLPTIVSPEEYQKRFTEAMHRYFLEVPDHWAGLGNGLDF